MIDDPVSGFRVPWAQYARGERWKSPEGWTKLWLTVRWKRWRKDRRRVWESKADVTDGGERCLSLYNIYTVYIVPHSTVGFLRGHRARVRASGKRTQRRWKLKHGRPPLWYGPDENPIKPREGCPVSRRNFPLHGAFFFDKKKIFSFSYTILDIDTGSEFPQTILEMHCKKCQFNYY